MNTVLLGIDLQNDFTQPDGALAVRNAEKDVNRIACFIENNRAGIDYIVLTLDSHQPIHIAHQIYWKDKDGNVPELFTLISAEDVRSGRWIPQYNKDRALTYLEKLDLIGEVCTIWPMHCIAGSDGWAIDKVVMDSIIDWSVFYNRVYDLYYKGHAQSTEHYSIFKAAVTWNDIPETRLNTVLLDKLDTFDRIVLVGEAADICVANSLNDILVYRPDMVKKIVVLTDCMSWIYPENKRAMAIFKDAVKLGATFDKSSGYVL